MTRRGHTKDKHKGPLPNFERIDGEFPWDQLKNPGIVPITSVKGHALTMRDSSTSNTHEGKPTNQGTPDSSTALQTPEGTLPDQEPTDKNPRRRS